MFRNMGKMVLVIIFIGLISACASAQTSNIGQQLVGTWIDSATNTEIGTFNSDGTGSIGSIIINSIAYGYGGRYDDGVKSVKVDKYAVIGNKLAFIIGGGTLVFDIFISNDGKTAILMLPLSSSAFLLRKK